MLYVSSSVDDMHGVSTTLSDRLLRQSAKFLKGDEYLEKLIFSEDTTKFNLFVVQVPYWTLVFRFVSINCLEHFDFLKAKIKNKIE